MRARVNVCGIPMLNCRNSINEEIIIPKESIMQGYKYFLFISIPLTNKNIETTKNIKLKNGKLYIISFTPIPVNIEIFEINSENPGA